MVNMEELRRFELFADLNNQELTPLGAVIDKGGGLRKAIKRNC